MALKKPYLVEHLGLEIEYWKIGKIMIDNMTKTIEVTLYGWLNEEHRLSGKPYVHTKK